VGVVEGGYADVPPCVKNLLPKRTAKPIFCGHGPQSNTIKMIFGTTSLTQKHIGVIIILLTDAAAIFHAFRRIHMVNDSTLSSFKSCKLPQQGLPLRHLEESSLSSRSICHCRLQSLVPSRERDGGVGMRHVIKEVLKCPIAVCIGSGFGGDPASKRLE
jgi:hypothetical protein